MSSVEIARTTGAQAAAASLVDELIGQSPEAPAPVEPGEQTAPEDPSSVVGSQEYTLPDFTADLSGIEDLLDEPEEVFADEPEPTFSESEETNEFDDPDVAKLKAKISKLEKQNQWHAEQRVRANEKDWRAEAARRFPLADVEDIQATSRRAVLRQAQQQHERTQRKLKPLIDAVDALKTAAIAEAKAEARQGAQQAYGRPTTGPGAALVEQAEREAASVDKRKPTGNLFDTVKARLAGTNHLGLTD